MNMTSGAPNFDRQAYRFFLDVLPIGITLGLHIGHGTNADYLESTTEGAVRDEK